jgi:hypothetical protein
MDAASSQHARSKLLAQVKIGKRKSCAEQAWPYPLYLSEVVAVPEPPAAVILMICVVSLGLMRER